MRGLFVKIILHVLLPLIIGYFIYFFLRPGYWFVRLFGERQPLIDTGQLSTFQKNIIFSGPDACWVYSLSSCLFIWEKWNGGTNKFFPALIFLVVILSEFIQLLLAPAFTFDWPDLIAAILGFLMSYLLVFRYEKK
jgi:hypothetical protein